MGKPKKATKSKVARFVLRIDREFYEGDVKKVADEKEMSLNDIFNIAIRKYIQYQRNIFDV